MVAPVLTAAERAFLETVRHAVLATVAPDGRPRLVPICLVVGSDDPVGRPRLYTPLDEKPKRVSDPRLLARVSDVLIRPEVTLLAERWDEDWTRLGWLRVYGTARLVEPGDPESNEHRGAVGSLRRKYAQYREHRLETRPILEITVRQAASWGTLD